MQPVNTATLTAGVGIDGDKHAASASRRQVLIADQEALDDLGLVPGTIKENLTVSGLDVMSLAPGTRLRLGAGVVLELTSVCEPCFRMDEIRQGLREQLDMRRGMNSRVISGGRITVGDSITIIQDRELAS
jgi:MOSC domain-containing protein YiiM